MTVLYGYYIDLDERGSFLADVRDANEKTVYTIRAGDELGEDETSIFDDGFMRDKNDLSGLTKYLKDLGVIGPYASVVDMKTFEKSLEELQSATVAYLAIEGEAASRGYVALPLTEQAIWDVEGLRDVEMEYGRRGEKAGYVGFPDGHCEWRGLNVTNVGRCYEDGKAWFCAKVDGVDLRTESFDIDELVRHADDGDFVLVARDQDALRSMLEEQGAIPAGAKPA